MRFGWLAAAAAAAMVLGAGQASAETISQYFVSTYTGNGSTGPAAVGGLNLTAGQAIRSATIFYDARTILSSSFVTFPGVADTGSITYSGTVGFLVFGLPSDIGASNAFSGTQSCASGTCDLNFALVGSLAVPQSYLSAFAATQRLGATATGTVDYTVTYDGRPAFLTQQIRATGVQGRIVYDVISVPEPASWALMITGIGLVGGVARRRKAAVSYS